jgi:SAM-dependent methyltransferase
MLPFRAGCFDVVVSNHSLEHVENLEGTLDEIGRVLKSTGSLYVGVPDALTITDLLYRWLAHGGGHVNQFSSAPELALNIERATGLRHAATRTLCTSLSFLNRRNHRVPGRLLLLGGGTQASLRILTYVFRLLDRFFGTRLSVYGWALYFGTINEAIDRNTWTNVCIFCGAGHPSHWLLHEGAVVERWLIPMYRCPGCRTINLFTNDNHYGHLATGGLSSP